MNSNGLTMLTPTGQCAKKIEKVMLLSMWAHAQQEKLLLRNPEKKFIHAGMGRPTYPINRHTIASYLSYWKNIDALAKKWHLTPEEMDENPAVDYGDPHGDILPRNMMAKVMSSWYHSTIKPEHILFTVGGIGALRTIFETLNKRYGDNSSYRIITPFPHYSVYANSQHILHPINVMNEPGYKVTSSAVKKSIEDAMKLAQKDHIWPKAILFCNPSNPLGNIIDKAELVQIAAILRQYPHMHIIFDEAYAEMSFVDMPSFLNIAPDLKSRTIILRSATKAFSAAGERMAMLIVFDHALMTEMVNEHINYFIHAPRSSQIVYAQTMANFDAMEHKHLTQFYQKKVKYVLDRLQAMGASMPDPNYQVEATFYALGDFNDLLGEKLPPQVKRVMQKRGKVTTDEEIAYYLMFKDSIMITPLSYFGLPECNGFFRITCSGSQHELKELMDRLENRLSHIRGKIKKDHLQHITQYMKELEEVDNNLYRTIKSKLTQLKQIKDCCSSLKFKNTALLELRSSIQSVLAVIKSSNF